MCDLTKSSDDSLVSTSNEMRQSTLEFVITNSEKTKAEILWALNCVTSGYSNNSCSDLNSLFQVMFPDSEIAKLFQLGPDKIRYMVNFGIAPYFKSLLMDTLKKSECFVVSFDESLNEVTQLCEMDLLVRFFDHLENKVKIRYFDSRFFGHGTHKDLVKQFHDGLKDLDPNKMYQISMDGPSVNMKFLEEISKERKADEQHQLINIGSCGLHTIHGALKTGAEKANWKIKETLKEAFQVLHDTPARREDYESVTGSTIYPLYFCATR